MPMFRKKPVEIEARRLMPSNRELVAEWCGGSCSEAAPSAQWSLGALLHIATPEGTMWARHGDWIIKGVNGEFYPCKPDIFEATYESVEETVDA